MNIATARIGDRFTDSVTLITPALAAALKAEGFDGVSQYLGGGVTAQSVQAITNAGLGFLPVTFADRFDGEQTVAECHALGLPDGVTVFLDVEGIGPSITAAQLMMKIADWAHPVADANYIPSMYVGWKALLTSAELYALPVYRYWKAFSRILDRNGQPAEPACGWSVIQSPTTTRAGVQVDIDFVTGDYRSRFPVLAVA